MSSTPPWPRRPHEAGIGIGAAWGSNFEGPFTLDQRMTMLERQQRGVERLGIPVTWVSLADPMSWCMPHWVEEQLTGHRADLAADQERSPAPP